MAGRSNSGTPVGGIRVGGRYLSPARVAAIRARNLARKPSPVDRLVHSLRPISAAEAQRLAAQHTPVVDDPTHTATDPAVVQQLRGQFSGPVVSGYNALKYAIGSDLAAYVPGTQPPVGFHRTPWKAAVNATELLPWERGAGAILPAVQAFRAHGDVNAAIGAARATFRGRGPIERASIGLLPKLQAARTAGLASANPAMRVATRVAWPVPFPHPTRIVAVRGPEREHASA